MDQIICLVSKRFAHPEQPHLPQVAIFKGNSYPVSHLTPAMLKIAVDANYVDVVDENVEIIATGDSVPNTDVFNVETATLEELKDFVQSDPDLDEVVDLRKSEANIRAIVQAYLEAQ